MGYLDEKAYLSASFQPEAVANRIVKSTTTAQDAKVDLTPALKKLGFDLAEVTQALDSVVTNNTDALATHAGGLEITRSEWNAIRPALENAKATQRQLNRDFTRPYERVRELVRTASALHATAQLARPLAQYTGLAQIVLSPSASLRRRAEAVKEIGDVETSSGPGFDKIGAIVRLKPRIKKARSEILDETRRKFAESLADDGTLGAVAALFAGDELRLLLDERVRVLVGVTVSQLSRSIGNPQTFKQALADAQQRFEAAERAKQVLSVELTSDFWSLTSHQLHTKLKTMRVANPSAIKALSQNSAATLEAAAAFPDIVAVLEKHIDST